MNIEEKTALNEKIIRIIFPADSVPFFIKSQEGYYFFTHQGVVDLLNRGVSVMHPDYSGGAGYKAVALTPACGLVEVIDDDLATAVALCFAEAKGLDG